MSASAPDLMSEPVTMGGTIEIERLWVPVEWSTTRFECRIKTFAPSVKDFDGALSTSEPVRLRVNETGAGSC